MWGKPGVRKTNVKPTFNYARYCSYPELADWGEGRLPMNSRDLHVTVALDQITVPEPAGGVAPDKADTDDERISA